MFNLKNSLQLILGSAVSLLFLYLTFSEVSFKNIFSRFEELNFVFLFISITLVVVTLLIRSLRWGNILNPILPLRQKFLFPISTLGISAIMIIPFRLGELVRPYLVSKNTSISFSSAIASIVLERILDTIMILLLLYIVLIYSAVPIWIANSGTILLITLFFVLLTLVLTYINQDTSKIIFYKFSGFFSIKIANMLNRFLDNFFSGLKIFSSPADIIKAILYSTSLWFLYALIAYSMFLFHSFELNFITAIYVLVITALASSLPAAPGFLGTFQYGCFIALTNSGVSTDNAAFFSISYYFVVVIINILAGLFFINSVKLDNSFLNRIQEAKES